jgi:tyrosyl-tRNA synthetase
MRTKSELALIKRGVVNLIKEEELRELLEEKRELVIKFGADPTAPSIHLGHCVILRKLRLFQELGNNVVFIIGDFTAAIGDPSGRDTLRPKLSKEEIKENALTYQQQIFKFLLPEKTVIRFNSEWLNSLEISTLLKLSDSLSVAKLLQRMEFRKRYEQNEEISLIEFLYPLFQGYDSVAINADIEIGGVDQTFNLLVGRDIQRLLGKKEQVVITLPLLEGLDGKRKMSKSLGNHIGVLEPPQEIFGKIMSIPDELMDKYYLLLTDIEEEEIKRDKERLHPMERKLKLARYITAYLCEGREEAAKLGEEEFNRVCRRKEMPTFRVIEYKPSSSELPLADLLYLSGATESKSEAKRIITQGGVKVNNKRITSWGKSISLSAPLSIKVGKRLGLYVHPYSVKR